jgi:hypothetical protein
MADQWASVLVGPIRFSMELMPTMWMVGVQMVVLIVAFFSAANAIVFLPR